MTDVQTALENLREIIAKLVADLETWNTLHEVKEALGLPHEEPERGKQQYLRRITAMASDQVVIHAAQRMLNSYPGTREKPSEADLQTIQDSLWWIESPGIQRISNVIRYRIAESLEGIRFFGRFSLNEFLLPIFPEKNYYFSPTGNFKVGTDGYLYEGSFQPSRISVVNYLNKLGLKERPDQRFCKLIESIVHPEVQWPKMQHTLYKQLNELLQKDNFELREEGSQGGLPVYKVRGKIAGVSGAPKYIIFASSGSKPDIVIDDVLNMNIRVVRYAEQCLVYDQPPPSGDLTWTMLVDWWRRLSGTTSNDADTRRNLGERLIASLQSEAERSFFATYFKAFKPLLGDNLPALLPQVYLHYDPRHQKERTEPVLVRQRMDFLMLLRNATRIVIEIDGVQHYSNDDGRASPQRYAEMVAEDRRIKGLGYEVYRFGGTEIVAWDGEKFVMKTSASETIVPFFEDLFSRHGILPKAKNYKST